MSARLMSRQMRRTRPLRRAIDRLIEPLEQRQLLAVTGAIFTTDALGGVVNGNIYDSKLDVYLNGGPRKDGAAGLPDGYYYCKVTEPDGDLLGTSISNDGNPNNDRPIRVIGGEFEQIYQLWDILWRASNNAAEGYDTTTNNGDEYKVWVSTSADFAPSDSKTDNFKVRDPGCEKGAITGVKFEDLDGDGCRDAGEEGLAGWTVFLDANDNGKLDPGETHTETGSMGIYGFLVDPGTYKVREVQKDGWCQTTPNPGDVVVAAKQTVSSIDFGNFEKYCISSRKFEDRNGDGDDESGADPGLCGWTIYIDENRNGQLDAGENSTVTGQDGSYRLCGIGPGTVIVREVLKDGWTQTYPAAGFHTVVGVSGQDVICRAFGNFRNVTITGQKFCDKDLDGAKDDCEPRLNGWTIQLFNSSGQIVATTLTQDIDLNKNGSIDAMTERGVYKFSVGPGCYRVKEVVPCGWVQTAPKCGYYDVKVGGTGAQSGQSDCFNDFGNVKIGGVGARTKGFWGNKNGREKMNDGGTLCPELQLLSSYNLRNADGSHFDPRTYEQLECWLQGANARNMAYMLSAQLAALVLNVEAGFVKAEAFVYASALKCFKPAGLTETGFIKVKDLIAAANAQLGANGCTFSGPNRNIQGALKDVIDAANNDRIFVVCCPSA